MGKEKTEEIEKIDKKNAKATTPTAETPAEKATAETVLAVIEKLTKNGMSEFSSRQISDKLGLEPDAGRQRVRKIMKKLEKEGKVAVEQKASKDKGARKRYVYRLR